MKYLALALMLLTMTACNSRLGCDCDQAPLVVQPVPISSITQQVNAIIQEANQARYLQGQTLLTAGLSCSVVQVASGQWLSSSSPGYNASQGVITTTGTSYGYNSLEGGDFNQRSTGGGDYNMVLPAQLQPLFININYRIVCSGQYAVISPDYYTFTLASDDGSILTIDGSQVINNDGNHGVITKTVSKVLTQGVHSFSLQYAQSGLGPFGLQLLEAGTPIDQNLFWH